MPGSRMEIEKSWLLGVGLSEKWQDNQEITLGLGSRGRYWTTCWNLWRDSPWKADK